MAAGSTYTPIATTTTAGTSSITFNSFSGYTDLILVCAGNETAGGYIVMRLNGDSGTNYSRTALRGDGTSASSARTTNETAWYPDFTTNPSTTIIQVMNYSNSTTYKTSLIRANQTTSTVVAQVNLWRNTAAITTITLASSAGGSTLVGTFTLYGIAAA
jgi:hypothetical protein